MIPALMLAATTQLARIPVADGVIVSWAHPLSSIHVAVRSSLKSTETHPLTDGSFRIPLDQKHAQWASLVAWTDDGIVVEGFWEPGIARQIRIPETAYLRIKLVDPSGAPLANHGLKGIMPGGTPLELESKLHWVTDARGGCTVPFAANSSLYFEVDDEELEVQKTCRGAVFPSAGQTEEVTLKTRGAYTVVGHVFYDDTRSPIAGGAVVSILSSPSFSGEVSSNGEFFLRKTEECAEWGGLFFYSDHCFEMFGADVASITKKGISTTVRLKDIFLPRHGRLSLKRGLSGQKPLTYLVEDDKGNPVPFASINGDLSGYLTDSRGRFDPRVFFEGTCDPMDHFFVSVSKGDLRTSRPVRIEFDKPGIHTIRLTRNPRD